MSWATVQKIVSDEDMRANPLAIVGEMHAIVVTKRDTGRSLKYPRDNYMYSVFVEDDESWYEQQTGGSAHWLTDLAMTAIGASALIDKKNREEKVAFKDERMV